MYCQKIIYGVLQSLILEKYQFLKSVHLHDPNSVQNYDHFHSVGPKAEVLQPYPNILDLQLRLGWPKFEAIPTAEGKIYFNCSFFPDGG